MLIERKVQIEAIKNRSFSARRVNNTIMFTEGHYIVYVPEKECLIDISKINGFKSDCAEKFSAEKVEKLLKPIGKTRKMMLYTGATLRLFENKETGDKIWLKQKYVKKFEDCRPYSADMGEGVKFIVFKRGEKIVGLVLPVTVSEDAEK